MILTKQIDYWPDLTSEADWVAYHMALVRVVRVSEERGRTQIQHRVEQQFSDGSMEQIKTVPLHHHWFGLGLLEQPRLRSNQRFVLYYRKKDPPAYVSQLLERPPSQSPLIKSLAAISRLRAGAAEPDVLIRGALGTDDLASQYALRRLLAQSQPPQGPGLAADLRNVRADAKRPAVVRVLASQLADRVEGKALDPEAELKWVQAALARSSESDWNRLRPFTERLLDLQRRPQVAKLLTDLAKDGKQRQSVRIAAYATFHDPRLFAFEHPDSPSEQVFSACAAMLNDTDPQIRVAGAALLHQLSARIAPALRAPYAARAKRAITQRARVEPEASIKLHLQNASKLFDRAAGN